MSRYRCYFIDGTDHIVGPPEIIDAGTPDEALERALDILRERPWHHTIELWEGAKRVYPRVDAE